MWTHQGWTPSGLVNRELSPLGKIHLVTTASTTGHEWPWWRDKGRLRDKALPSHFKMGTFNGASGPGDILGWCVSWLMRINEPLCAEPFVICRKWRMLQLQSLLMWLWCVRLTEMGAKESSLRGSHTLTYHDSVNHLVLSIECQGRLCCTRTPHMYTWMVLRPNPNPG